MGYYHDELLDADSNPANRPDFSEDELAQLAQERAAEDPRIAHLEGFASALHKSPTSMTIRELEQERTAWEKRTQAA